MQVLVGLSRRCLIHKRYQYSHFSKRSFVSVASYLKSLNTKLEYTQLQKLSVDESLTPQQNQKPRLVKDALFTKVDPTPLKSPKLLSISSALTQCIDLDINTKTDDEKSMNEFTEIFAGNIEMINKLIPNCTPYSHCYVGHQFGNFAGQLGDGRAICLGEYVNDKNNERYEIQLKGAGLTPYSRFADGRAVLRSSIREYLISEAMYYLGVPTTRAGVLIGSDHHKVIRDEFYNGNARHEQAAIVTRLSPSFIRFGSFEICSRKGGPSYSKDVDKVKGLLKPLLDYVIEYFYCDIWNKFENS